jgi:hypothetical protein
VAGSTQGHASEVSASPALNLVCLQLSRAKRGIAHKCGIGVLYAAQRLEGAFVETLLRRQARKGIDPPGIYSRDGAALGAGAVEASHAAAGGK